MFGQATKRIHLWIATALRCARRRGPATAPQQRRCPDRRTLPKPHLASGSLGRLPPLQHRHTPGDRSRSRPALRPSLRPSLPSPHAAIRPRFPPPLPSPAPMWRPGRGRQGRRRQPPPFATTPGLSLAPPASSNRPPPATGPASTDGSGARRIYPSLRHRDRQSVFM
ncbi:phostensin-like [Agelaius tricolor]|uniref:phostensin-like n=1 Tax=Agelaius tricolor TaxID=9191 RepID=UPI0039F1BFF6